MTGEVILGYAEYIAELKRQIGELKQLTENSATLHTNILRGTVQLDRAAALHIAGAADYDELRRRTDWTPVGERLPETNGGKLVTYLESGKCYIGFRPFYDNQFKMSDGEIAIAWREMPAPYQGNDGNID